MRAVGITHPGDVDVLAVVDGSVRAPGRDEVLIAVRAAGVNQADIGMRKTGGRELSPPWTPGMEAAGVIEAVGPGVDRLPVGAEVMAVVNPFRPEGGAQAEKLVVPASSVVAIPGGVTLEQAATLPMNGLTAKLGLESLGLGAGMTLAVTGGAGQLAAFVIPMAKDLGLRVIADAMPADVALVRELGADDIVARGDDFGAAVRAVVPAGADGVFDTAAIHERAFPAVRDGGVVIDVTGWQPDVAERDITVKRVFVFHAFERTEWLEELRELASRGRLQLRVAGEFAPEKAGEAHALVEAKGLRGRPVIVF